MGKDESRKFGAQGGKKRAANMSKEERKEQARKAALVRWGGDPPVPAAYGSEDRPLRLGNAVIPAYVLADGRRVLTQRGLQAALGFSRSGGKGGARRLVSFLSGIERKGLPINNLASRADSDIRFILPRGGVALGYEATILEDLCNIIVTADAAGKLTASQKHIADEARLLHRGFARVGVIAMVDEVTGFQKDRPAHALAEILDAFIAKELRPWVRKFPFEFYQEIFRLKGWDDSDLTPNSPKPVEVGRITTDVIYARMGPAAIFKTLKRLTPRNEKGYLKNKLHSWFTSDVGDPKLDAHIGKVVTVMKLSDDWHDFMVNLEKAGIRKYTDNYELPFGQVPKALPPTSSEPDAPL
jgi:hypothetical protein